jgi:Suppressor of fused protein (SUFU)
LLLAVHPGFSLAWRQLAVLAAAPAVEGVVYAPGATVDTGTAWLDGSRCTGAVIAEADIAPIVTAGLTITLLSVLPATANELAWARVHGANALRDRWATQSVDLRDLDRPTVRLD